MTSSGPGPPSEPMPMKSSDTVRGHQAAVRLPERPLRDELVLVARQRIPDVRAQPRPPEEACDLTEQLFAVDARALPDHVPHDELP